MDDVDTGDTAGRDVVFIRMDGQPDGAQVAMPPRAPRWGAASGIDAIVEAPRWHGRPPADDAYSRVTDADRYRPLHGFALALADDLEAEFDVTREEGLGLAAGMQSGVTIVRAIRLTPRAPDAAPFTLGLTDFPGLTMRFGQRTHETYPLCGCDACDDLVQDLVESVRDAVDALTSGGFAEGAGGWSSFRTTRGSRWGGGPDPRGTETHGAPWPRRSPTE